jgi:hypothetical protein
MFGGAGVYCDGRMFALVADGEIYVKAGPGNRQCPTGDCHPPRLMMPTRH